MTARSARILFAFLAAGFFGKAVPLAAQPAKDEVATAIQKLDNGQAEEVRRLLPELIARHQNDAGVLYLEGRTSPDGVEAVKYYQSILDNFPKSEWADDALYRIYQYYYALGLYRTADLKMQQLEKEYPGSPYIGASPAPPVAGGTRETAKPPDEGSARNVAPPVVIAPLPGEPAPTRGQTSGMYTLQVGAFSTFSNAEKQRNLFEELGYAVEITNKVRNGRSLYLVWVGDFKTADDARRFGKEVRAKFKIESIVVERY